MINEYLNAWIERKIEHAGCITFSTGRGELVERYSWAIPNNVAINELVSYGPLIEIGAGLGYWAKLVFEAGGNIIAFDIANYGGGMGPHPEKSRLWFPVQQGTFKTVIKFPERTLFLCWPPYSTPMAYKCLRWYEGKHFIYVGEDGGCTGDELFREYLNEHFKLKDIVTIPQWDGIHDAMFIYERK
jgi:hypothetical protein